MVCDWSTGKWTVESITITTSGSGIPRPARGSGLAVCLLGSEDGYRVFYTDAASGALQHLRWTNDDPVWSHAGVVSRDQISGGGGALAATFPGDTNMTVVVPRDGQNLGFARWYDDDLWHLGAYSPSATQHTHTHTHA